MISDERLEKKLGNHKWLPRFGLDLFMCEANIFKLHSKVDVIKFCDIFFQLKKLSGHLFPMYIIGNNV